MTVDPLVIIIILNWNHPEDTLACLHSVVALHYPAGNMQILVVDNGSSDKSAAPIRAAFPDIELIQIGVNLGYAGGNNVGIRCALAHGADYVWLLNDDATVAPDALKLLVRAAESHPGAGFLGPMVRIREQPDRILSAGGFFGPGMTSQQRGLGELDRSQYSVVAKVDYLSGCALLVSRVALERIGMLDEQFFAYGEDVEWCYRGKQAGFDVLFVPEALAWHPDTRERDQGSARVTYYISRNRLLFLRKHRLGIGNITRTLARNVLWLVNWTVNPKWRHIKPKRNALWLAMRDFALGRFGKSTDL